MNKRKAMIGRVCLECVHCHVDPGSEGYSEYTPGSPFEFHCGKGKVFQFGVYHGSKATLLADIRQAETCDEFKLEVKP